MTLKETYEFLATMQVFYMDNFKGLNKKTSDLMAEVWHKSLKDESFEQCLNALERHANSSEFCPKLANIKKELADMNGTTRTAAEAWERCFKLAINLPNYPGVEWNLNDYDLDEAEKICLGSIRIHDIKMSENIDVLRSNFIKLYSGAQQRIEKESKMPQHLALKQQEQKLLTSNNDNTNNKVLSIGGILEEKAINNNKKLLSEYYPDGFFDGIKNPLDMAAKALGIRRKKNDINKQQA
jgi:hypothetical protein